MDPVKSSSNRNVVIILVLLVIILGGTSGYLYKKMRMQAASPEAAAQAEAEALASKVGMLIVLPTDETPTIATVSDPAALKDQPFFANAKMGDKVLIYTNAKKAILFDPTLNKILNVAPLNIGDGKAPAKAPVTDAKDTKTDAKSDAKTTDN